MLFLIACTAKEDVSIEKIAPPITSGEESQETIIEEDVQPPKEDVIEQYTKATTELDLNLCGEIDNKDIRLNCEEIVFATIISNASEKKDSSLCQKISEISKKQECIDGAK